MSTRDNSVPRLVGVSPRTLALLEDVKRCGPTGDPVLIFGESGSGKESVAHELFAYRSDKRRKKPFEAVNCGSLDPGTADNELFGSVPGAFTGALDRPGLFERANGGVLFLDEIGDLPPATQVKLLRAVQDGVVRRVGGSEKKVDVRLIAATDQDLQAKAQRGEFRIQLLNRFDVKLRVPPLRERLEDIDVLVAHFIGLERGAEGKNRKARTASPDAIQKLRTYHWPGNVRELRAVVRAAMAFTSSSEPEILEPKHFILPETPRMIDHGSTESALRAVAASIIDELVTKERAPAKIPELAASFTALDLKLQLANEFFARSWPDQNEAARRIFTYADAEGVRQVLYRSRRTPG